MTTYTAGPAGGQTFTGSGAGNTLELSSSTTLLTINADTAPEGGLPPLTLGGLLAGVGGATTDTFSDIQTFVGNTGAGGTMFIAGPTASAYEGAGIGPNTLSYAGSSAASLSIDTVAGTALADAVGSTFSCIQTFVGLAGGDTDFITDSTGGFTFTGLGAGSTNALDFSAASAAVSINTVVGTAQTGSGADTFSNILHFVGDGAGGATFISDGSVNLTFTGKGANNTLDLSAAPASSSTPLTINATTGESASGTATSGATTDHFSDVQNFIGSGSGSTTFVSDGAAGLSFAGMGFNNILDLTGAPAGLQIDAAAGTVVDGSNAETFSDIQTFKGGAGGGATFVAGSTSGLTFIGLGGGNTFIASSTGGMTFTGGAGAFGNKLELGSSTGLLTINATSLPVGSLPSLTVGGLGGGGTDTFSNIQTFVGNTGTGGTTFLAAPGAATYDGVGTGTNTLSYAFSSAGSLVINTVAGTAQAGAVGSTFSGIQTFVGLASGNTTFITGSSGGLAFTGTGSGNALVLGGSTALLTIDASASVVSGLQAGYGGATTDAFSDIATFAGNTGAGGTTFIAGPTNGAFEGEGTGTNTLSLTNVVTSTFTPMTINATTGEPASGTAQAGSVEDTFSGIQNFVGSADGNTTFASDGADGLTFTGEGFNNTLDLHAVAGSLTLDFANDTVQTASGTEHFSDIQTFDLNAVADIFIASTVGGLTFTGGAGSFGNTLLLGSSTGLLTINATNLTIGPLPALTVGGLQPGVGGATTDTFSDIQSFGGNTGSGGTTFLAGPGADAYQGAGTGTNTLSYAFSSAGSLVINTVTRTAQADAVTSLFVNIQSFVGLAGGNTTFITGSSGGLTFTATGFGNALELGGSASLLTIDANAAVVSGLQGVGAAATDAFSGIGTFEGNTGAGGTTFIAGPTAAVFAGEGTGPNTLSLANVVTSTLTPLTIDVAGTATSGATTDHFSDIQKFVGSADGNTTFVSNGANGLTFTGEGFNNTLDLSAVASPLTVDLAAGTVQTSSGTEHFSDIQDFVGSGNGATTFISNGASGLTFTGEGVNNTLDLSAVVGAVTLNLAAGTATTSAGGEHFFDIQTFKVSAASGGVDLAGIGTATTFSYDPGSQTLTLLGGTQTVELGVAPPPSGEDFSLASDGAGGTLVTLTNVAGTYLPPGATAPIQDPAGTYSGPGASAPTTDLAGTFSLAGAATATSDPAGTYSGPGAAVAILDPAGTFSPAGAAAPTTDPAGTFSGVGASVAITDSAGTFSGPGAATATTDPAGTFSGPGAPAPTTDPAGTFSGPGAATATSDPAGTYSGPGAAVAILDPAGTFSPAGAAAPTTDPAGTFSGVGASVATTDSAGTFSGPGAATATTDPAGTFSGPGAPAPTTDPAGTFSGPGAAAPTPAAAGTYIPTAGATSAAAEITDPAGTYSGAGAAAPTQDPAGTFSGVGATTPTTDPAGTYSGKGAAAPTTDPAGTYSGPGASAPTADPAGTFSDPGASAPTSIDAWKKSSGGAWTTAANWKSGVPNASEYAGVQAPGTYAVTIGSASAAYGLIINDAGASVNDGFGESLTLDGSNGASSPNGALYITAGKFNLEGGALKAASISIGTGGAFLVSGSISPTLAEAITDLGTFSISNSAAVTVTGSLSGSGAVLVQDSASATFAGPITGSETFTISNRADVRIASSIAATGSFNLANRADLEFAAGDTEAVNFLAGSTGVLKIDKSLTAPMTGTISGLTTSNGVDLADLGYVSGKMKATYAGTAAGGTLTISNGTRSVALTLAGNYLHSTWTLSKDGSGGTLVVDPPAGTGAAGSLALFGQLAASMPTPSGDAYSLPIHDLAFGARPVLARASA